jgi:hypothetical protein
MKDQTNDYSLNQFRIYVLLILSKNGKSLLLLLEEANSQKSSNCIDHKNY